MSAMHLRLRAGEAAAPALVAEWKSVAAQFDGAVRESAPDAFACEFTRAEGEETVDRVVAAAWEMRDRALAWALAAESPVPAVSVWVGDGEPHAADGVFVAEALPAPLFGMAPPERGWRAVSGWITGFPGQAALPRPALHGCSEVMLAFRRIAAVAQENERPAIVLLNGERGGGKSLALAHGADALRAAGFQCHEVPSTEETKSPMASLAHLVRLLLPELESGAASGEALESGLSTSEAAAIAATSGRLGEIWPLLPSPLLAALRAASATRPQAIVLDDAQLLARETLQVVKTLAEHAGAPVVFLLSTTPEHLPRVRDAVRCPGVPLETVEMPQLDDETAARIAHATLGAPFADREALAMLVVHARRNPCLFLHVLAGARESGVLRWRTGGFHLDLEWTTSRRIPITRPLTELWGPLLRAELLRETPPALRYAQAIAVVGLRFRPRVLERQLGSSFRAAEALEYLRRNGFVWSLHAGDEWRWSHSAMRRAVLAGISKAEQAELEAAAADAQLAEPARDPYAALTVAAKLWERAGRMDRASEAHLELARRFAAGDQVARAEEHARRAIALWEEAGSPDRWRKASVEAWMEIGRCAGLQRDGAASVAAFERAANLADGLNEAGLTVRILRERGWAELRAGSPIQARFRATQLLERAALRREPGESADALSLRAAVDAAACRWGLAEADLRRAHESYRSAGRSVDAIEVEHRYAHLLFRRGEVKNAQRLWARLAGGPTSGGLGGPEAPLRTRAHAAAGLAAAHYVTGRFEAAEESAALALQLAQQSERVGPGVRGQLHAALARAERGSVASARSLLATLGRWAEASHDPLVAVEVRAAQAQVALWCGRADEAIEHLESAKAALPPSASLDATWAIAVQLARLRIRRHDFSDARECLETLADERALDEHWLYRGEAYAAWAELAEAIGDQDGAREWASKAQSWHAARGMEVLSLKAAGIRARNEDLAYAVADVRDVTARLRALGAIRAAAVAAVWTATLAEKAGSPDAESAWAEAERRAAEVAPGFGEFAARWASRDALRAMVPEE